MLSVVTHADGSQRIVLLERLFYVMIFVSAVLVTGLGYFAPEALQGSFSWFKLPPLHARFVATLYLAGGVYVFAAMIARRGRSIQPALGTIAVFTGVMFLVTLRNLSAFDFSRVQVWAWFLAYLIYPVIAVGLILVRRNRSTPEASIDGSSTWVRKLLWVHAVALGVLGATMFLAPDLMVTLWPWPVTGILVQAYGSPFLALAYCAAASADRRTWPDVMPALLALLALYLGTLIISWVHSALFSVAAVTTSVWFGMFAVGMVTITAAIITTSQRRREQPQHLATNPLRIATTNPQ